MVPYSMSDFINLFYKEQEKENPLAAERYSWRNMLVGLKYMFIYI